MIYNSKYKNNCNIYLFIIITLFIIINNKNLKEKFIVPYNNNNKLTEESEWIKDNSKGPLLEVAINNKFIVYYKNYKYNFKKELNSLKEFKIYNKYDYNKGLILFNKFIKEINYFNKIYCTNFINYMNNSYKSLFIDNAYNYLKDSIKHFSYINLSINDKSLENAIMKNNFNIYELNNKLYDILGNIYGVGFNIIYIISRDNNYNLDYNDKFLNIYSNYIYLNNPDSFMDIYDN